MNRLLSLDIGRVQPSGRLQRLNNNYFKRLIIFWKNQPHQTEAGKTLNNFNIFQNIYDKY